MAPLLPNGGLRLANRSYWQMGGIRARSSPFSIVHCKCYVAMLKLGVRSPKLSSDSIAPTNFAPIRPENPPVTPPLTPKILIPISAIILSGLGN
jgi:hypothetical protein